MADDLHALVAGRLRRVDQRYTSGRRALVDVLVGVDHPVTAAELVDIGDRLPQSTAYRNLAVLEQAGVVRRVLGSDEYARFELAEEITGRHHHHLVCTTCGAVEDFEPPQQVEQTLADAIAGLASTTGFQAQTHRLDLLGTCTDCNA